MKTINKLDLLYSRSQVYRRINALVKKGLIEIERGSNNEILLNQEAQKLLRGLAGIEKTDAKSLKASLLELENQVLRERVEAMENQERELKHEIELRNKILSRQFNFFQRFYAYLKTCVKAWLPGR